MSEKELEIGNRIKVVGPSVDGCTKDMGHVFTIYKAFTNYQGTKLYTNGQEYNYPASSLRLAEEKPQNPINVVYEYPLDNFMHGHFEVSCPCGRKASIFLPEETKSEWAKVGEEPELKIGDWVKVVGPCHPWYIPRQDDPSVFQICRICEDGAFQANGGRPAYLASSLRKLAPEEVKAFQKENRWGTHTEEARGRDRIS